MSGGSARAPAKINLCLHVTGRRADGYHLIDSLAVFADVADVLHAEPADAISMLIGGPFGAGLDAGESNLVVRAARALGTAGARLHLEKYLPVASGIGGGSADAAAALRLLSAMWGIAADLPAIALRLGADVPVCLAGRPARMRGIGEVLDPVKVPRFGLVLINPGVSVATAVVFAALAQTGGGGSEPLTLPGWKTLAQFVAWLRTTGNDLQGPALALCPPIRDVLSALEASAGCLLARMSGSGATCFGVFSDASAATRAAAILRQPGWWVWGGECAPDSRPDQGAGVSVA